MSGPGQFKQFLRAGGVIARAIATPTGPRRSWRRTGRQIALGLAIAFGAAGSAIALTSGPDSSGPDADRARIEAIVRDYILTHPEIIPEAYQKLREKRSLASLEENRAAIEKPYPGAWEGAENGDVVLVAFMDYACGYCRASIADIKRLLAEDGKLKVVYRELPVLGEASVIAARVALLAADQGRYAAYHLDLYERGPLDKAGIEAAAAKAGLDRAAVKAIMGSRASVDELNGNIQLAQALDASGTPLFVVGNKVLNGAVGYDALKAAIVDARAARGNKPAR
jgi:protein-disulfide isomerase